MRLAIVLAIGFASTAAGCAKIPHPLHGERIAGEVVDADTGQPIAGVHVAFVWEDTIRPSGITGHNSRTICYHAAAAITDAQGRFEIPPWRKWSTFNVDSVEPTALVYTRGYTPLQKPLFETGPAGSPKEHPNERFALGKFSGTVDQRLDAMWGGIGNRGCDYGGKTQKTLYPMLKEMYQEARDNAVTPTQLRRTHSFAVMTANAALAQDPNGPSNNAQVNDYIDEFLK